MWKGWYNEPTLTSATFRSRKSYSFITPPVFLPHWIICRKIPDISSTNISLCITKRYKVFHKR